MLCMLALVGQPVSVAVMHIGCSGLMGHPGEIAGKMFVRPLFLLFLFFCGVEFLGFLWVGCFFGIFGLVVLGILGQALPLCLLRVLNFGVVAYAL